MSVIKDILRVVAKIGLMFVGLLVVLVAFDHVAYIKAHPPANMQTLQDFESWKLDLIIADGTYTHAGKSYAVRMAPAGRHFESGPAAYLFDQNGQFVDWTSDMGDFVTKKHHFSMMSGAVSNYKRRNP